MNSSLIPRPSHCPLFDCLQYAKTGRWEGLGTRLGEQGNTNLVWHLTVGNSSFEGRMVCMNETKGIYLSTGEVQGKWGWGGWGRGGERSSHHVTLYTKDIKNTQRRTLSSWWNTKVDEVGMNNGVWLWPEREREGRIKTPPSVAL